MYNLITTNNSTPTSSNEAVLNALCHLDSKGLLSLTGMLCLTTVICIGIISFSNSEMTLSKNGLSITHPRVHA